MPLNLGKTALSAIKLGENALAAIYNGINRVYPNEVTVSIDGANASSQSGSPGTSMNNFIYVVTPSNVSTYGWTSAQIAAATLTGLPTGFTATFSASGSLGSQSGTWNINTTNNNFPLTDVSLLVSSLSSNISETLWGTINVNFGNNSSGWSTGSASGSDFVGASLSFSQNEDVSGWAAVGQRVTAVTGGNTTYVSGQNFTASSVSFNAAPNAFNAFGSVTYTVAAGTSTSNVYFSGSSTKAGAIGASYGIVSPPWGTDPITNIASITNINYSSGNYYTQGDSRVKYWLNYEWTGSNQQGQSPYTVISQTRPDVNSNPRYASFGGLSGSGGSFTVFINNNVGLTAAGYDSNPSTRFAARVAQVSWNWIP